MKEPKRRGKKQDRSSLLAEIAAMIGGRKITCADAVVEWAKWRAITLAPNTVRTQELCLRHFLNSFNASQWQVTRLTLEHMDAFVNADDGTGASTRIMRTATLRSFCDYISAKAYYVGNPAKLVRVKRNLLSHEQKETAPRVPFTEQEFNKLVEGTDGFWKAAVLLSYWTGLRLSDVACLEWASVQPEELIVWTRKRDARVALPISDPLLGGGALRGLFFELMLQHKNAQYVFPEERKVILDPEKRSHMSVYFGRILAKQGIKGKSFHCLRHSFATRLAQAGKTIEEIGRVMGHSKNGGEVTSGYIHK